MENRLINETFSTIQWFIFLLANAIALPIVIGGAFNLSIDEIASLMQRVFFVMGISTFIQGWMGHRLPLADGPAGSWVSIFVILADISLQQGQEAKAALPLLESAIIISGILLLVLGMSGIIHKILFLFTPLVTGSFLLLLALQLSGVFLGGMLAIDELTNKPDYAMAAISFLVFILVILLSNKGRGWMKSYAVLIGILVGWGISLLFGKATITSSQTNQLIKLPEAFAWGLPEVNAGIIITAFLFTFLLISNTIAAITAVQQTVENNTKGLEKSVNRGIFTGGLSHLMSGGLSTIPVVQLPVTSGFIQMTGQKRMKPFLIASILLSLLALLPGIVHILSLLPGPVANAALMASFINMIGIALTSITKAELNNRRITIIGITLLVSFGLMFLPKGVFTDLPSILQYVLNNGLLVGTFIVILLEQFWKEPKEETTKETV